MWRTTSSQSFWLQRECVDSLGYCVESFGGFSPCLVIYPVSEERKLDSEKLWLVQGQLVARWQSFATSPFSYLRPVTFPGHPTDFMIIKSACTCLQVNKIAVLSRAWWCVLWGRDRRILWGPSVNPVWSTQEKAAGEPGLCSETLFQNNKTNKPPNKIAILLPFNKLIVSLES